MKSITVENIYSLKVCGSRIDLEFVTPGGIDAIKVTTDQFVSRLFKIDENSTEISDPDHDPFRDIARDICIFAATGRHPSDRIKPESRSFAGLGLQRAADLIRDMYQREVLKVW